MTAGTATPSVASGSDIYFLFQSGAQSVTGFTGGSNGNVISVYFGDANTTLDVGGDIHLSGGIDYNPPANTLMAFKNISGAWYEQSRVTY